MKKKVVFLFKNCCLMIKKTVTLVNISKSIKYYQHVDIFTY